MRKVRDILETKGHEVWSIEPGASVYDAMKLMADKGVGALLVMEGAKLVGIISERDYARKIILQGRSSRTTEVREIMTSRVVYAEPERVVPVLWRAWYRNASATPLSPVAAENQVLALLAGPVRHCTKLPDRWRQAPAALLSRAGDRARQNLYSA